jgi:hypothetical protein
MLRRWLAVGVGVAAAAVVLVGGVQWTTRPATYRAAVLELLEERAVAYTAVQVREDCWPAQQCFVTAATHTVATVLVWRDHARAASYGQIRCYDRRGECCLDLAALGLVRARLRDQRGVRLLPKPLARVVEDILTWVRMLSRRL